ncbi:MAG: hypothetical protein ACP5M0_08140 [Desulfomonilaceae bacterium]
MTRKRIDRYFRRLLSVLPANAQTMVKGVISYLPGIYRFVDDTRSVSPEFCYSVWLRHLVLAHRSGLNTEPEVFLELGPGSSLGVGLCALLCGSKRHYALDAIPFAKLEQNLVILDRLIDLFMRRADIPSGNAFSTEVKPALPSYEFPREVLTDERLERCLTTQRIEAIRDALIRALSPRGPQAGHHEIDIQYFAPWSDPSVVPAHSVDMVLSNTVLQCVEDLPRVYEAFSYWLKPGGSLSNNIDYSSYGATTEWNGHWACSRLAWRLMRGNRPYLLNRQPHSVHVELTKKNGFRIVAELCTTTTQGITRKQLAKDFSWLSDDDLHTTGALIQAIKED